MSHHREVHVVMAGLIALHKFPKDGRDRDLAIFVRDPGHQLQGRVYGFDEIADKRQLLEPLALANHRVSFDWAEIKDDDALTKTGYSRCRPSGNRKITDPPLTEDDASHLRVPNIRSATDLPRLAWIDKRCVEPVTRRVVAAQALLDTGELCSGHLVDTGGLVPQLYFRGSSTRQTCADVMVLKMVAPDNALYLRVKLTLLSDVGRPVEEGHELSVKRDYKLSVERPLVVSLTNQSRPVSEISTLAGHFRMYRKLLAVVGRQDVKDKGMEGDVRTRKRFRPRVYVPRLRGGEDSSFATVQPGMDFDGIEGVTPPSVQNRSMCPFAEIPEDETQSRRPSRRRR